MKKIIFSDYDGTLDTSDIDIIYNIRAILKFRDKGNLFVIATGRSFLDLKRKLDIYPIPYDYLILNHGGVILDKNNNIVDACLISKEIAEQILSFINLDKNVKRTVLFSSLEKDIKELKDLTKILLELENKQSAISLSNFLNKEFGNFTKSYVISTKDYNLVEIISKETNKAKAIEKILKIENIQDEFVYTIGDGTNDVEMILKYNGYGMKNSEEIIYKTTSKFCNTVSELIQKIN